jgi:hypothetical protein
MQIFFDISKTKYKVGTIKSELVFELGKFRLRRQVSENLYTHASTIYLILLAIACMPIIIAVKPIMDYYHVHQLIATVVAIPFVMFYVGVLGHCLPRRLIRIALDDNFHYILIKQKSKSIFWNFVRTEYLDIHQIENISEGQIKFNTGKIRELAEIDTQMASAMNTAVNNLIVKSGGIAPAIRRKRSVDMEFAAPD